MTEMEKERLNSYEYGLPPYLQHDLDAYKEGLASGLTLLDCLWCELYGSINAAEITDGVITPEHADYLRQKFLWRHEDLSADSPSQVEVDSDFNDMER